MEKLNPTMSLNITYVHSKKNLVKTALHTDESVMK